MRLLLATALLTLTAAASGCGSGGDFPVTSTTGVVLCEEKPVANVMVLFEPLVTGNSAIVGKQGIAFTDSDGRFAISTYGSADGAVLGKHRVRVGPPRDPEPGFRCDCVLNSEVNVTEVEVTREGPNDFALRLEKKNDKSRLSPEEIEAMQDAEEAAREAARR